MMKIGVMIIHGIGVEVKEYIEKYEKIVRKMFAKMGHTNIEIIPIYYDDILKSNQHEFEKCINNSKLHLKGVRNLTMQNFGAATIFEEDFEAEGSPYQMVMERVYIALQDMEERMKGEEYKLFMFAHSLGTHIISNYIYDAQKPEELGTAKFWKKRESSGCEKFEKLTSFLTFGCGIPIFISGMYTILPFKKPNAKFKWFNYYDRFDILGYPLKDFTRYGDKFYEKIVTKDIPVHTSWHPSKIHFGYWTKESITKRALTVELAEYLK
jgi:hypothetical protein